MAETFDTLCGAGWRCYYDPALFPPGTDSFLLSAFPRLRPGLRICDLGAGTGLLGLLLLRRQPSMRITGVELDDRALALAERNASENHLEDRLRFLRGDLRKVEELPPAGAFDLVVCNPPYFPVGSGAEAAQAARRAARSEICCSLEEACAAAARLLRWGGRFCLVHRPERLADLLVTMRRLGLECKRLRTAALRPERAPSLLLAEGLRGGKPGLIWEPPLILQDADGGPSPEYRRIYCQNGEELK
jgi:tRNA1(Val) A37 N6-methylase TrmN6